jgi:hypothetical protein
MNKTRRASRRNCLAAARRKYGKAAWVHENRAAPTAARREEARARAKACSQEIETLRAEQKELGGDGVADLLAAAQFVVDVGCDPTAVARLGVACRPAARHREINELCSCLRDEQRALPSNGYRWSAGKLEYIGKLAAFSVSLADADTLDELYAKLSGAAAE